MSKIQNMVNNEYTGDRRMMFFGKRMDLSKRTVILAVCVVAALIILGATGFWISRNNGGLLIEKAETAAASTTAESSKTGDKAPETQAAAVKTADQEEIKVYVVGCVKREGIVSLRKGQILDDAVKGAGGFTEEADPRNINLAYILNENCMVKVKSKKEAVQAKIQPTPAKSSEAGQAVEIVRDSGGAVEKEEKPQEKNSGKININTATAQELDTLPRVGEKTAEDIIAYREKIGGFKKIEELMDVPRIGQKTFDNMKGFIDVK